MGSRLGLLPAPAPFLVGLACLIGLSSGSFLMFLMRPGLPVAEPEAKAPRRFWRGAALRLVLRLEGGGGADDVDDVVLAAAAAAEETSLEDG